MKGNQVKYFLRKAVFLLALVVLFPSGVFAAPAFWKVLPADATDEDAALYLFGSFHLLKAEDDWLTPDVSERFSGAARLVLEADAEDMDPAVMQRVVRTHALYPQGLRLSDRVPADVWMRLDNVMGRMGGSAQALQQFKPWYAALVASVRFAQSLGFEPTEGVDQHFLDRARQMGKPIEGLEDAEEQLGFFFNQDEAVQVRFLDDTLRQVEETPAILDDMTAAWRDGDLAEMERLIVQSMQEVPEVYDALLVARNRLWVDRLIEYTRQEGATFVVVGAAHLVGQDSVIRMLSDRGFTVERLNGKP